MILCIITVNIEAHLYFLFLYSSFLIKCLTLPDFMHFWCPQYKLLYMFPFSEVFPVKKEVWKKKEEEGGEKEGEEEEEEGSGQRRNIFATSTEAP